MDADDVRGWWAELRGVGRAERRRGLSVPPGDGRKICSRSVVFWRNDFVVSLRIQLPGQKGAGQTQSWPRDWSVVILSPLRVPGRRLLWNIPALNVRC